MADLDMVFIEVRVDKTLHGSNDNRQILGLRARHDRVDRDFLNRGDAVPGLHNA